MLPHLNRPGYSLRRFQGKTHFQSKHRSQPSLGSCRDGRQSGELPLTEVSAAVGGRTLFPERSRFTAAFQADIYMV